MGGGAWKIHKGGAGVVFSFSLCLLVFFFLSHLTFFWRPLPPLCASLTRPAQEENAQMEMSCAHRPLWVVALLKIFFFFFIFRRHSIFPFFFLDILLWKKIKSKFSLLFLYYLLFLFFFDTFTRERGSACFQADGVHYISNEYNEKM